VRVRPGERASSAFASIVASCFSPAKREKNPLPGDFRERRVPFGPSARARSAHARAPTATAHARRSARAPNAARRVTPPVALSGARRRYRSRAGPLSRG
jgi:hypothetical protein